MHGVGIISCACVCVFYVNKCKGKNNLFSFVIKSFNVY